MNLSQWTQSVKERDGWECQECGVSDNLHAHHIKPRALGGKNVLDNGRTLCVDCHNDLHRGELSGRALHRQRIDLGLPLPVGSDIKLSPRCSRLLRTVKNSDNIFFKDRSYKWLASYAVKQLRDTSIMVVTKEPS